MIKSHKHKLLTLLIMPVVLLVTAFKSPNVDNDIKSSINTASLNNSESFKYKENKTSYENTDGTRNIYWAQGVSAPIVTLDRELHKQKGYFFHDTSTPGYDSFTAEFQPNKGYYDYNKNIEVRKKESNLCYLGSSMNLISWWLEQNKEYVDQYLINLQNGVYGQDSRLYDLLPYNQQTWDEILAGAGDPNKYEIIGDKKGPTIGTSPLGYKYLSPFYQLEHRGYFQDKVLDFFFNGYDAFPLVEEFPNKEEAFTPDKRGGFFAPLLGKTQLTKVYNGGNEKNFDFFEANLGKLLSEGKGVSFTYTLKTTQGTKIHAVTLWGAEYDLLGNLKRVYLTDTDDTSEAYYNNEYYRGLASYDTYKGDDGYLYFTQKTKHNQETDIRLSYITTLDLAKDLLNDRLSDTAKPNKPELTLERYKKDIPLNTDYEITYKGSTQDNGYLEYQWYESDTPSIKGTPIDGANSRTLKLKSNQAKTKYYTLDLINIKNGHKNITTSDQMVINYDSNATIKHAQKPIVNFNPYNQETFYLNEVGARLYADAKSKDGGTLSYQWYTTGSVSQINNGRKIEGATNDYLDINTKNLGKTGYYVVVTNSNYGSDITGYNTAVYTPNVAKTVNIVKKPEMENALPPQIRNTLSNASYYLGDSANSLTVDAASKDGQLSYQWYEYEQNSISANRKPILNANTNTFIPKINEIGTKYYACEVINTNNDASVNKTAKTLTNIVKIEVKEKPVHVHSFGEWEIIKDPTYTETGLKRRVCECGEIEEEVIPKLEKPTEPDNPNVNPETPDDNIETPEQPDDNIETPDKPDDNIETPEVKPSEPEVNDKNTTMAKIAIGIGVAVPLIIFGLIMLFIKLKQK